MRSGRSTAELHTTVASWWKNTAEKSQSAGFEPARVTPIDFKSIAVTTWLRLLGQKMSVRPVKKPKDKKEKKKEKFG
jgi:hypothetical protein